MKSTPFNPSIDMPPIPFDKKICKLAKQIKDAGLKWNPHVGCFVWDQDEIIEVPSPFPERIYFILNLNHFVRILGSSEAIAEKLIWLPTWHQARLVLKSITKDESTVKVTFEQLEVANESNDLSLLYKLILKTLEKS